MLMNMRMQTLIIYLDASKNNSYVTLLLDKVLFRNIT